MAYRLLPTGKHISCIAKPQNFPSRLKLNGSRFISCTNNIRSPNRTVLINVCQHKRYLSTLSYNTDLLDNEFNIKMSHLCLVVFLNFCSDTYARHYQIKSYM